MESIQVCMIALLFLVLPCLQIYSTLLVVYSTVALDLLYSTRSCDLLLVPTVRYRIRKAVFNMIQHDDYVDRYDGVE